MAGVWTRDINKALALASRIKAGQVYVNTYGAGGGVELPFGGYKKSGYGREKGLEALASYTQVKNVCIRLRESCGRCRAAGAVPWARAVCAGIARGGLRVVVYVPDNPLVAVLRALDDEHRDVRTVLATREEEAFGIAAGLYLGGSATRGACCSPAAWATRSTRSESLLVAYQIPAFMILISMRGDPASGTRRRCRSAARRDRSSTRSASST